MTDITAYIGLGSNLSNPIEQLKIALQSIDTLPSTRLVQSSSFYGSKPLGPQDQPDFVNAVCKIKTKLSAEELLHHLQKIELEQGRIKKRHWGERLIDLDILLFGDDIISTDELTVPHKQIALRDFVLIPLAEIAPGLIIPKLGKIESLIAALEDSYLITLD
ncbi:2-amino-4-hydroxy-6-hydroxymethyldihydropteridine diphosphokinase [Thiomicrorhabdus lithotrophica]|uniref:2-amino-4-hydroxy-6-hydroxymethyldihydropteridine pyrophosphokinase n=1 Tax=Thiomicrorhabdus lithotrophica TaxID=2949997 RepID=A0ABY8CDK7_9GAMM|nr:2-amino-4-hydroxy-6-hydroxymethyldihydropteridine diphosphokinase [Thiomicrorhabdus lithotrophica]WEJ63317.1 2-amino-4-hydroxy-6-hydroxymethyldihydropteridine diphosphokinase [Thiomicrorhabdus lithotrophica]